MIKFLLIVLLTTSSGIFAQGYNFLGAGGGSSTAITINPDTTTGFGDVWLTSNGFSTFEEFQDTAVVRQLNMLVTSNLTLTSSDTVPDDLTIAFYPPSGRITWGVGGDLVIEGRLFDSHFYQWAYGTVRGNILFGQSTIDYIRAEWFGADGQNNDTNDDWEACRIALDIQDHQLNTLLTGAAKTWLLAPGFYYVSDELVLPNNAHVKGTTNGLATGFKPHSTYVGDATGDKAILRTALAKFTTPGSARRIFMEDVFVDGLDSTNVNGILACIQQPGFLKNIRVDNCRGAYGLAVVATQQGFIMNYEAIDNDVGLWLRGAEFFDMIHTNVERSTIADIWIDTMPGGVSSVNVSFVGTVHLENLNDADSANIYIGDPVANLRFSQVQLSIGSSIPDTSYVVRFAHGTSPSTYDFGAFSLSSTDDSLMLVKDDYRNIVYPTTTTNRNVQRIYASNDETGSQNFAVVVAGQRNNRLEIGATSVVPTFKIHKPASSTSGAFELFQLGDTDSRFTIADDGDVTWTDGTSSQSVGFTIGGDNRLDMNTDEYIVARGFVASQKVISATTSGSEIDVTGATSVELNFSVEDTVDTINGGISGQRITITSEGTNNNIQGGGNVVLDSGIWEPGTNEDIELIFRSSFWQELNRH